MLVITGRGSRRRRCALARGNADAQRLLDANDHWRGRRRGALPPRGRGRLLGGGLGGLLLGRLGPRGGSALAGLRLLRCGFLGALLCEELLGLFDELGIVVVVFSLFVRGLLQLVGGDPVFSSQATVTRPFAPFGVREKAAAFLVPLVVEAAASDQDSQVRDLAMDGGVERTEAVEVPARAHVTGELQSRHMTPDHRTVRGAS